MRKGGHKHQKKLSGNFKSHLPPHAHDRMAHPSHHQANEDHGTPNAFAPPTEYQDGGCDHHLGDNVAEED